MQKFKRWLLGSVFTWLTDCSGLAKFFEATPSIKNHVVQRWRMELLQFHFVGEHRPEKMLTECNFLSRCNAATLEWNRILESETSADSMHMPCMVITSGPPSNRRAEIIRIREEGAPRPRRQLLQAPPPLLMAQARAMMDRIITPREAPEPLASPLSKHFVAPTHQTPAPQPPSLAPPAPIPAGAVPEAITVFVPGSAPEISPITLMRFGMPHLHIFPD